MKSRKLTLLLDEEAIGTLEEAGYDMPWTYGKFLPLPPFEKVERLFRLAEAALDGDAEDSELHWKLLEQINRLNLVVVHPNGSIEHIEDFKIEEGQFEYKAASDTPAAELTSVVSPGQANELPDRLQSFVFGQGGSITEKLYAVAGSQEVVVYSILLPDGNVEAVLETYMGLSLSGPTSLVAKVEAALRGA